MTYNIPGRYSDLAPVPQLDKKTLNKMVWMSCFLQTSFNYKRMQACEWLWGILPNLQRIRINKDGLKAPMAHDLDFLNTYPFLVILVMGTVSSLEQNKTETQTTRSVRTSAIDPLDSIGNVLFWLALVPITAGIMANMALNDKSIIDTTLFLVIFNVVQFVVRWWLMCRSYNLGTKAVTMLTSNAKGFTRAASILGIFVVGGLIANYGATSLRTTVGSPTINTQGPTDEILPKLIPLLITLGIYTLVEKGWISVKCILLILIAGIVRCALGIWAGDSKAMNNDGSIIADGYNPLVEWYTYDGGEEESSTKEQKHATREIIKQLQDLGIRTDVTADATSNLDYGGSGYGQKQQYFAVIDE